MKCTLIRCENYGKFHTFFACYFRFFLYLCTGYVTNAVYRAPAHGASHREVDVTVRQVGGQGDIEPCPVADGGLYVSARPAFLGADGAGTAHDRACSTGCSAECGQFHSLFGDDVVGDHVSVA